MMFAVLLASPIVPPSLAILGSYLSLVLVAGAFIYLVGSAIVSLPKLWEAIKRIWKAAAIAVLLAILFAHSASAMPISIWCPTWLPDWFCTCPFC